MSRCFIRNLAKDPRAPFEQSVRLLLGASRLGETRGPKSLLVVSSPQMARTTPPSTRKDAPLVALAASLAV